MKLSLLALALTACGGVATLPPDASAPVDAGRDAPQDSPGDTWTDVQDSGATSPCPDPIKAVGEACSASERWCVSGGFIECSGTWQFVSSAEAGVCMLCP